MVINIETNLWRDTKSGAYGSIYDLATRVDRFVQYVGTEPIHRRTDVRHGEVPKGGT